MAFYTGKKEGRLAKVKRFQIIEHTADVGMIAYGRTLAEAFANAAYGMFSIIAGLETVR